MRKQEKSALIYSYLPRNIKMGTASRFKLIRDSFLAQRKRSQSLRFKRRRIISIANWRYKYEDNKFGI
jgi:hypothetical protein